ncbi:MAG: type II CAAX endopeptidase family protein [Nannocystaceae bacterium]
MSGELRPPRPAAASRVGAVLAELGLAIASFGGGVLWVQLLSAVGLLAEGSLLGGPVLMLGAGAVYQLIQRGGAAELRAPLVARRPGLWRAWGMVAALTAALIAGSALISLLLHCAGVPAQEQPQVRAITDGGWRWDPELMTLALGALILAPIGEEWLFRGLLFRRLWLGMGPGIAPKVAYPVTALLFAAAHYNPSGVAVYVWQAVVFGGAYRLTGRLWFAMLLHFANNALTLVMLLSAGESAGESAPGPTSQPTPQPRVELRGPATAVYLGPPRATHSCIGRRTLLASATQTRTRSSAG